MRSIRFPVLLLAVLAGPALAQSPSAPETIGYVDDPHPEQVLDLWWPAFVKEPAAVRRDP